MNRHALWALTSAFAASAAFGQGPSRMLATIDAWQSSLKACAIRAEYHGVKGTDGDDGGLTVSMETPGCALSANDPQIIEALTAKAQARGWKVSKLRRISLQSASTSYNAEIGELLKRKQLFAKCDRRYSCEEARVEVQQALNAMGAFSELNPSLARHGLKLAKISVENFSVIKQGPGPQLPSPDPRQMPFGYNYGGLVTLHVQPAAND
ncbi:MULTISPECIES: hypothetical protein [Dyella]|uniref:DUF541 domain-containing protein n=2 Tax=Dyella TaxID=231454 RepID=A0A4R0YL10_9GAMM|nr:MULTISPECIES: hypothetical protein [Dyella]TBR36160.1 hypothetical protein EYV96_16330 [Dyella terrae]TCI06209.1 hypothetical protein EZM97_35420 [Dyella soli]